MKLEYFSVWKKLLFMNQLTAFNTVFIVIGLHKAMKAASMSKKVVPAFYLLSKGPINHQSTPIALPVTNNR
jgi:hypothetical protein